MTDVPFNKFQLRGLSVAIDARFEMPRVEAPVIKMQEPGTFVAIRLAGPDQPTHLGIYMGEMQLGMGCTQLTEELAAKSKGLAKEGDIIVFYTMTNPAIYVPELRQIHYGMESWWGSIESPEQLREITKSDIMQTWYVVAARQHGWEPNL